MIKKYITLGFFLVSFQINTFAETLDIRITDQTQDTEERVSNGKMDNNDGSLDIGYEKSNKQLIGLRFENVAIPQGSTINSAYLQFTAKVDDSKGANFILSAEASDNAAALTTSTGNVSSRTETTAKYNWDNVPSWEKNKNYQTGDLSALVQEVTDRNGWEFGNAIALIIQAGSGCDSSDCRRRAKSRNNTSSNQPLLHIDFTPPPLSESIIADYRLDECYWLGGANGISGDIVDSSSNNLDASSVDRIDSEEIDYKICRSGSFGDNSYAVVDNSFTLGNQWSMSVWVQFPFVKSGKRYYILGSYPGDGDLPVFQYDNNTLEWGIYNNSRQLQWNTIDNSLTGWHHLTFVNAGAKTTLYLDGSEVNSINLGTSGSVAYLWTSSDDLIGQSIASNIDEMKFFGRVMTPNEIDSVYKNENHGDNYDGSPRDCPSCDSASISARSWELVGIPADNSGKTVAEVFTMAGTYGADWRVYRRDYSDTNNSSWNTYLAENEITKFGKGYWLGSAKDDRWDVSALPDVTYSVHPDCAASKCVEIELVPISLDSNATPPDDLLGTGAYRNHLSGFVGLKKPVDWKDCRFIIDGQAYTPKEAEDNNFSSRQVWLYNPNESGANNNGYTTCADNSPGGCKLVPFKGFSVELRGPTKNKTVKLLIPQE